MRPTPTKGRRPGASRPTDSGDIIAWTPPTGAGVSRRAAGRDDGTVDQGAQWKSREERALEEQRTQRAVKKYQSLETDVPVVKTDLEFTPSPRRAGESAGFSSHRGARGGRSSVHRDAATSPPPTSQDSSVQVPSARTHTSRTTKETASTKPTPSSTRTQSSSRSTGQPMNSVRRSARSTKELPLDERPLPRPRDMPTPSRDTGAFGYVPSMHQSPIGLDVHNFLPQNPFGGVGDPHGGQGAGPDDFEILEQLQGSHAAMMKVLDARLKKVRVVRTHFARGDIDSAVEQLSHIQDDAVTVDVLKVICHRPALLTLSVSVMLMPLLIKIIQCQFEDYILSGLKAIRLVCKGYSNLILESAEAEASGKNAGSLVAEERAQRLAELRDQLVYTLPTLRELIGGPNKLATVAKNLWPVIEKLRIRYD